MTELRGRLDRYVVAAFGVVAAMSVVAVVGFGAALSGWSFLWSVAVAVVGAAAIALVAHVRRLLLGESVAITAVAYIALGGIAAGGLPTPGAYGDFFDGLVNGWAEFLSSPAPADVTPAFRVLPYTIAWFACAIGAEVARHSRRPGLPAIGPVLGLGLTLLFTVEDRALAVAQGAGVVAGTLLLVSLAHRWTVPRTAAAVDDQLEVRGDRTRVLLGALVVVGAVAAAPWLGPRLPLADAHDRYDLRRYQVPPFDPLGLPSPLVQVKANLKESRRDDVVFTVTGDRVELWPVAVMTDYDGVVWTVGDPERNRVQAEFAPVDTELPVLDREIPDDATRSTHTVTIGDLGGSFLPTAGVPERVAFEGPDPDPRMNLTTGTIALPGGARSGLTYELTSAVQPEITEAQLTAAGIRTEDFTDDLELLPPGILNLAADLVQGEARGWPQMAAIRDALVDEGFYDATDETPPGHSFGRLARMLEDPEQIVGYEEQYAAAAALLARIAGLPVRVVVGYRVPDDRWQGGVADVTADDVAAWVEIDAGELGWVPVAITPPRDRQPDPQSDGTTEQQVAIPNPPPPPPPPPEVQPPRQEDPDVDTEEEFAPIPHAWASSGPSTATWIAVGVGGGPLLLLLVFVAIVVGWKSWRRHRRRTHPSTAGRVAGAWAEASDRAVEAGAPLLVRTTPHEAVGNYVHDRPDLAELEPDLRRLAREVDRASYAAAPPTDAHAAGAWEASDRVAAELRAGRSMPRRMKMRLDPRPLRRDQTKAGSRS